MPSMNKLVCARAARHEFGEAYQRGIRDFRESRLLSKCARLGIDGPLMLLNVLKNLHDEEVAQLAWDGTFTLDNADIAPDLGFRVMARKRPLLSGEQEADRYDTVSTEKANNSVVVHDGRVHRDGRTLYMNHSRFCLDRIFTESEGNDVVYDEAVKPLLQAASTAEGGGRGTLVLFGQTGTGKTYTANGTLRHLCDSLFAERSIEEGKSCSLASSTSIAGTNRPVSMLCYEIAGTRGGREAVFDLLSERKQVKALTGEDGQVHVRGAQEVRCEDKDSLAEAIAAALAWRSSESTERNEASSRSHAVIELHLPATTAGAAAGVLRVVDLAGSERNYETLKHTRQMAERGGHINYSLLMLKECARIMHKNKQRSDDNAADGGDRQLQHVPFRSSRLTHLLKSCFTEEAHRTVVIATLSPAPTDVEHSLNSLQHIGMMRSGQSKAPVADKENRNTVNQNTGTDESGGVDAFSKVEGRGHNLHSKLQDARQGQLKLHAFGLVTQVGGGIMRKYEAENMKTEAFIDERYHREMKVVVEEDVWVMKDADAEVVQVLNAWREEQWEARKAHDIQRWNAAAVRSFVASLGLPGQVRLPSTMTGAQLCRLGQRGIKALCSDDQTYEAFQAALVKERTASREVFASQTDRNAKISALGAHKVHVTREAASVSDSLIVAASEEANKNEATSVSDPLIVAASEEVKKGEAASAGYPAHDEKLEGCTRLG